MKHLSDLSLSFKSLSTCLILTLLIGYAVSIVQIYNRSQFDLKKTVLHYRGDENDSTGFSLPATFATLLSVSHVHTLSQPFIFGSIGFVFCLARWSERKKALLIILGFSGSLISNLAPWLIRYVSGLMVWLLPASQVMIATSLIVMSAISLYQMWFPQKNQ